MRFEACSLAGRVAGVFLWCLCAVMVPAAAAAPKNVLILAEGPVLPYSAVLRAKIVAGLRNGGTEPLNIYEELIDRSRHGREAYDRELVALLKAKYSNPAPDLIITITAPALDFVARHRRELFPASPLLFGVVDERAVGERNLGGNVTGVFSHFDARATVQAALALHPATRQVVVIGGTSRLDQGYVEVARQELSGLASPAAITYITDQPLNTVLATVAALEGDQIVLFLSMQMDGEGVARTGPEVVAALRRVARVPIYGMSANFLGAGIVGGMLFDNENNGPDMAQRARQILSGIPAADLPSFRTRNTLAFDARELKRFGVAEARLPAGATVVNREPGLWEQYERSILGLGALLVGQSLLIGGLLFQRHRRRQTERRNSALLRAIPDLMFLQTLDGVYLDCHAADPAQLLTPPEQFLGKNMRAVLPPALLEVFEPAFARLALDPGPILVEYGLDMTNGHRRYEARMVRSDSAQVLTLVRDITERKRSADQFRLALEAAATCMLMVDRMGTIVLINARTETLFGYPREELIEQPVEMLISALPSWSQTEAQNPFKWDIGAVPIHESRELNGLRKNGTGIPLEVAFSPILTPEGQFLLCAIADITERRQAEREREDLTRNLRDLAGRLIAAQEVERARIARDLHDDVSQQLAGLSIGLSGLRRRAGQVQSPELQGEVSALQDRTMMLVESVRRLSHDLHPDVLRHVGLAAALKAYCAGLSAAPLVVTCSTKGDFASVHPDAAVCLYRIAQEALHNVVKHAHASHARVGLVRDLDDAELTIADDGRGFNLRTGKNGPGLGLISITERVRLSGGTVSIVAAVNKGTQVRVRLPLSTPLSTIASGSVTQFATPPDGRQAPVAHSAS